MRARRFPKIYHLALCLIYALAFGVRIYYAAQKDGLHRDEVWSLTLANGKYFGWTMHAEDEIPHRGDDLRAAAWINREPNLFSDLGKLWLNTRDQSHSNFYYSLLRTGLTGVDQPNVKTLIRRGVSVNLAIFTVEFLAFAALLVLLFPRSPAFVLLGTFVAFLSPTTISLTLFLRPYLLQQTMFVILAFCVLKFWLTRKIITPPLNFSAKKSRREINCLPFAILSMVTALTLLTGYFSVIYIGVWGAFALVYNFAKERRTEMLAYVLILFFAVIFATALYPHFYVGFVSPKSKVIASILAVKSPFQDTVPVADFFYSLIRMTHWLRERVFPSWTPLCLLLLTVTWRIDRNISRKQNVFVSENFHVATSWFIKISVPSVAIFYTFIAAVLSPLKIFSYQSGCYIFFTLVPLFPLSAISRKSLRLPLILVAAIFFGLPALNAEKIEWVYRDKSAEYIFRKNPQLPVIVGGNEAVLVGDIAPDYPGGKMILMKSDATKLNGNPALTPYYVDDQKYIFTSPERFAPIAKKFDFSEFYLVMPFRFWTDPEKGEWLSAEEFLADFDSSYEMVEFAPACFCPDENNRPEIGIARLRLRNVANENAQ